jgi:orotidine-5'-phosphate decarboxylase
MNYFEFLKNCVTKNSSHLCIGLDPEFNKIPDKFKNSKTPFFDFNREIIDSTFDLVACYKPQFAHYAAHGREEELFETIKYIKQVSQNILVILDFKRGDIGNTSNFYAKEAFSRYGAHSATVNPYMGFDSVSPFVENPEFGIFILCRTSNPSSKDFQSLILKESNQPLFMEVAKQVSNNWNVNKNCGLVLGATFPKEMEEVRQLVGPDMPFLIPGIGAQGGDLKSVITASYSGLGSILINSSRGIIHKDSSLNFSKVAREAAIELRDEINTLI